MSTIENADKVRLFALNSNPELASKVADKIGLPLNKCKVSHFADGEISVEIEDSVRGCEVYVIQSVSDPVNTNLMELLIMVDALRRASAAEINVVMPYYGYARQDRKARSREPITAKLVANLLEMDKINRLITIDLHASQVQGFFDIPVDHLIAAPLLASYFIQHKLTDNVVLVAPDHAGVSLTRKFAEFINVPIAIIDNRDDSKHEGKQESDQFADTVIGDVKGKNCIIVDDIVDTGTRLSASAKILKKFGALDIYAAATHAVFSANATDIIEQAPIKRLVITDTIKIPAEKQIDKLRIMSVATLLKEAMVRNHNHQSIDSLFHGTMDIEND